MKIALIDFDGTLVNHEPSMKATALEIFGKPLSLEQIATLQVHERARIYDVNLVKYAHLYENNHEVVEFVKGLKSEGFETKVLTARLHKDIGSIRTMLISMGLEMEIICRQNNAVKDQDYKLDYIRSLGADHIILLEDKPKNIEHICRHMPEIEAYLVVNGHLQKE